MTYFSRFRLKNILGNIINPATEDKQDVIVGYVDGIESEIISTNTKLDTLNSKDFSTETTLDSINTKISDVTHNNIHTTNKELRIYSEGHICTHNSSNTPLGISGVFDGDRQDTLDYSEIIVSVSVDQNSAVDGLVIYWSSDGITTNETDEFSISANKGKTFSFPCNRRYMKLIYTNGLVAQTVFDIQTILKRFASKGSSHRIKDSIVGDDDAILVKGILTGLRDDGVFSNATLSNSNRLKIVSQPYTYAVAERDIPDHDALIKFGTRTTIAANVQSLIWEGTNPLYTYLTSAEQLKVSSSSANDTVAGTGARTLTIIGLDSNYDEISETIDMNGLTTVTTVNSYIRIFRAFVATSGTFGGSNIGTINITNNAGTNQLLVITIGDGQTLMTLWTVPRGKRIFITNVQVSTDSNKGARFSMFTRQLDGGILYPWRIRYRAYLFSGLVNVPFGIPFEIPEKTDIEIRFLTPASAGVTSGGATFEGWYENI